MSYRIGIDIGTTSTKAVLYGQNLERLAAANVGYRIYQDRPGYQEQDPYEILGAFKLAVHKVLEQVGEKRKDVGLISFSGAMHSLILVDDMGRALTRSIIWSDNRSVPEVEEFRKKEDWLSHYKNTGTPIHSMSPFFKLRWLKNHTDLLDRTYKAIGIKEFIIHELTGVYMMDYSTA
ncbi:MAG TPA: FGGY family carbohydrate kinase, partial [Bacteroidales bacterium]|nr:FGGY family carbohydrate kinase [Bacteroidales bacterium]